MEGIWQWLILGGLFLVMMRFGCGSHMFGHGSKGHGAAHVGGGGGCCGGGARKPAGRAKRQAPNRGGPPEKDVDPVCGMTVLTAEAKASVHDGSVYFLCSQKCREAFESSPERYVSSSAGQTPPLLDSPSHPVGGNG